MSDTYRRSDNSTVRIDSMQTPHLKSALAKLEREEPSRIGEIAAMKADLDRRDAEFKAHVATLQAEGYGVAPITYAGKGGEDLQGFILTGPFDPGQYKPAKTEEGAWWPLLKERGLVS